MVVTGKRLLIAAAVAAVVALVFFSTGSKKRFVAASSGHPTAQLQIPPAPPLVESFWREETLPDGTSCRLNLSPAVFKFDIKPWTEKQSDAAGRLWPDYRSARRAVKSDWGRWVESVDWSLGMAKVEEDAILAELELVVLEWQRSFVRSLITALETQTPGPGAQRAHAAALAWAHAARMAAEPGFKSPNATAQSVLKNFASRPVLWRPLGFYASTAELTNAWRAQRFLTAPFPELFSGQGESEEDLWATWAALQRAAFADASLRAAHNRLWRVSAWLEESSGGMGGEEMLKQLAAVFGHPAASDKPALFRHLKDTLKDNFPRGVSFLPRQSARETLPITLAAQKGRGTMDGVMNSLAGQPQLAALDEQSGWYARQRFSLLPLLRPQDSHEAYKLALTAEYRDRLRKAFAASLTKVRETHISRSWFSWGTLSAKKPSIVVVKPKLDMEPLATVYLRRAEASRWVRDKLAVELGAEPGTRAILTPLLGKVQALEERMLGLYAVSAQNLGMTNPPALPAWAAAEMSRAESVARDWLRNWESGAAGKEDTRYAVPVVDKDGPLTYWSTVGVQLLKLEVRYEEPPALEIKAADGKWKRVEWVGGAEARTDKLWIILKPEVFVIPTDVFMEFERAGAPLTRDEFRKLLAGCTTVEKARRKLGAR
jgi:hypothetical protein